MSTEDTARYGSGQDITMGELYSRLKEYTAGDYYPYHMPGHKRHLGGEALMPMLNSDITEIEEFDNLHDASGILRQIQMRAAQICGAEESFYLINGSTAGILSALSAAVPEGGKLLMVRGCHKAAYHTVYLRRIEPVYLWTGVHPEFGCQLPATAEEVRQALLREPGVQAVLIVSPTYEGLTAEVAEIAAVVHTFGIPLIVDEAHGAHLGFHPYWHQNSIRQGADLVVQSLHKTLPAPTQTALLHVSGGLIDRERLRRFLRIYQSSSPSYPMMAAMEEALELADKEGQRLFSLFREHWEKLLHRLAGCTCLRILQEQNSDAGKLAIMDSSGLYSGQALYEQLLERYHLQAEMAAGRYVLAMFTIGDTEEGYERLAQALLEIDMECAEKLTHQGVRSGRLPGLTEAVEVRPDRVLGLTAAWDGSWEKVGLAQACGRISAEFVSLYPPGIPLIVPGESFGKEMCEYLQGAETAGLRLCGVDRGEGACRVRVLRETK